MKVFDARDCPADKAVDVDPGAPVLLKPIRLHCATATPHRVPAGELMGEAATIRTVKRLDGEAPAFPTAFCEEIGQVPHNERPEAQEILASAGPLPLAHDLPQRIDVTACDQGGT